MIYILPIIVLILHIVQFNCYNIEMFINTIKLQDFIYYRNTIYIELHTIGR